MAIIRESRALGSISLTVWTFIPPITLEPLLQPNLSQSAETAGLVLKRPFVTKKLLVHQAQRRGNKISECLCNTRPLLEIPRLQGIACRVEKGFSPDPKLQVCKPTSVEDITAFQYDT